MTPTNDIEQVTEYHGDERVDVELIMQEIRQKIWDQKAALDLDGPPLFTSGDKRLSADYYEYLYQVGINCDQIEVDVNVTPVNIPIVGSIIESIRTKIHELVLFYVNQLAANQMQINKQILQALNQLTQDLEAEYALEEE